MKRSLVIGVASALACAPVVARAAEPSKEECIAANESAQTQRKSSLLLAARKQLLVCLSSSCPTALREDCAEQLSELEKAIPTIVFAAKGTNNVDLTYVTVTVDGAPLTERLLGVPLGVDPGEHTFEFSASGYPTASRRLVISEGVKARQEIVALAPPVARRPVTPVVPGPRESDDVDQKTIGLVLGGFGLGGIALGTYFGLRAKSTYADALSNCPSGTRSCNPDGVSGGAAAHAQATGSTVAFILGGAALAGGVVVYLTAPKQRAVSVQPTVAGLRVAGSW